MENYNQDTTQPAAKIVVIGVGGAGCNAVNRMIDEEIDNVEFWVANTDKQALSTSKSPNRLVLGEELTGGLGAGGNPEVGESAAQASVEDLKKIMNGANMVFIAAGMGGGTGTGAAPIVAKVARDSGALVMGIVTRPFSFEERMEPSIMGLNKLKEVVDSMIVVNNDKLLMNFGALSTMNAFGEADKVLAQSVKTIVNLIMIPGQINLDFADIKTVLKDSGVALIGFGMGSGPNRVKDAVDKAITCPLIETPLSGARRAIVAITIGTEVSTFDAIGAVERVKEYLGKIKTMKFGFTPNSQLSDEILVSIIAGDFETEIEFKATPDMSATAFAMHSEPVEEKPTNEEVETKNEKDEVTDINPSDFLADFLDSDK